MAFHRLIISACSVICLSQMQVIRYVKHVYIDLHSFYPLLFKIEYAYQYIFQHRVLFFSGLKEDPCKDITFGACFIDRSSIIKKGYQADAITCQEECRNHDGCEFFHYNPRFNLRCTLLSSDYRKNCDIIGGSLVCNFLNVYLYKMTFTTYPSFVFF